MYRSHIVRLTFPEIRNYQYNNSFPENEVSLFQNLTVLELWVKHFLKKEDELFVWGQVQNGELTHIFPYYLHTNSKLGFKFREMCLLGNHSIGANYLRPCWGKNSLKAWSDFLEMTSQYWDILRLEKVDPATHQFLQNWSQNENFNYKTNVSTRCPIVRDVQSLDHCLSEIKGKKRNKFKKIVRNFESQNELKFSLVDGLDLSSKFQEIVSISKSRFSQKNIDGAFCSDDFTNFHQDLINSAELKVKFGILEINGVIKGFNYYFQHGVDLWFYQGGFVDEISTHSPGLLLHLLTISAHAKSYGKFNYDFLEGDERYKYEFPVVEVELYDFIGTRNKFLAFMMNIKNRLSRVLSHA